MDPLVHRSPERKYQALALTLIAAAGLRTIVGSHTEIWGTATVVILGVLLLLWAAASWRSRTILTPDTLEDIGTFRRRKIARSDIDAVSIVRTPGIWDGFVLRLDLTDGREVPVTSSRVYSVAPFPSHLADLEAYLQQVRGWLRAPARS